MNNVISKHKPYWTDRNFIFSTIKGLSFLVVSLSVNYIAATYATLNVSNSVKDILLDNLPVVNVDFIFNEGAFLFLFLFFIAALLLYEPKRLPFMLKGVALFVVIRSIFVVMTHLGPFPDQITIDPNDWIGVLTSRNDLFFSGHTGLPFLFALAFWDSKNLRLIFLSASFVAATSVILGHLHYTIDVFAAFFITYGIFHIAQKWFAKDYRVFLHGFSHEKNN